MLRVAYDLPDRGGIKTRLLADLLHVGNAQRVVRVDELLHTAVDADRVPTATNARYGAPLGDLPPMAVRIGIEVSR